MGQRLLDFLPQYQNRSSVVLAGAKGTIFAAGTENLVALFSDVDETLAIENPFTFDAAGMAPDVFYADSISIKLEIRTADGSLFRTADNLPGRGGPTAGVSIWATDQSYVIGEEVVFQDVRYTSNTSPNKDNTPTSADVNWTRSPYQGVYNTNLTYVIGDRVIDPATGILFVSRVNANNGNTPSSSPAQWANGSSIGIQTVNIPGGSTNVAASGPAISSAAIGEFIVVTREFTGAVNDNAESAQFSIKMPESWDQSDLQAIYTIVSRTAVAGGSDSAWGISATGFASGETITDQSFGTEIETVISAVTTINNFYDSSVVTFTPNNITTSKSNVYFKVSRINTDLDGLAASQSIASPLTVLALTSLGAEIQQLAKKVLITASNAVSQISITYTVTGTDGGGTPLVESGITGPAASVSVSTTGLFATVSEIKPSANIAAATTEAGYDSRDDITSNIGLENIVILYNTVSSTDNA